MGGELVLESNGEDKDGYILVAPAQHRIWFGADAIDPFIIAILSLTTHAPSWLTLGYARLGAAIHHPLSAPALGPTPVCHATHPALNIHLRWLLGVNADPDASEF
jgi:hypothetical protein